MGLGALARDRSTTDSPFPRFSLPLSDRRARTFRLQLDSID
jgi:hypothetical protein